MSERPEEYWHKKNRKKSPKIVKAESSTPPASGRSTDSNAHLPPRNFGINEDGNQPYRKTDVDILVDIKELPLNYVKGMGLIKDLEQLEALPSGSHWSIGYERREIMKRIQNDLGSGLDRYYGQKEPGGGLVAKTIPGSSVYMDADPKSRRVQPSETGERAFTLLFAHRREILDSWTRRNDLD